jgi:hypothetical protein
MASYQDLATLDYFGAEFAHILRAVGWLERGDTFSRGASDVRVITRLRELLVDPFAPFAAGGPHACSLCAYFPEASGSQNLFVPADGFIFVCPELIVHYMNAHQYLPPPQFCNAIVDCPDQRSLDFRRRFLASGGAALVRGAG